MAYRPEIGDVVTYAANEHSYKYVVLEIGSSPYTHLIRMLGDDPRDRYKLYDIDIMDTCILVDKLSRLELLFLAGAYENT